MEGDLRRRYGTAYDVQGVSTGAAALELLEAGGARGAAVALVLADHRLGRMSGRDVLAAAARQAPAARRVLLVLPEDTGVALEAITAGQAHDYLVKPWVQPQER